MIVDYLLPYILLLMKLKARLITIWAQDVRIRNLSKFLIFVLVDDTKSFSFIC